MKILLALLLSAVVVLNAQTSAPVVVDAAKHPKVAAWSEAILSRPSLAPWVDKEERMMAKVLAA